MAELTAFTVGYCTHPAPVALRGAGWRICRFPARAYLLSVGDRHWLWDTGYASHFHDCTRHGLFRLYRTVTPVHFDEHEALLAQLRAIGLGPTDIRGLILSHFHGDHIAGLRDFAATPCICAGEGWQRTRDLRGIAALRRAFVPGLIPPAFETTLQFMECFPEVALPAELAPFERARALPGSDEQILLVPLPGHAAGQIGAFVHGADGWSLLASDAAWSPASYREVRGPARLAHLLMDDPVAYYDTLRRLNALHRGGQVRILLCHEGDL